MSARAVAATDNDIPTYFIDEGSHKYRTELPNLIDDLSLSVYAHRLYTHIKRRAGEGEKGFCTAGLRGMAKSCGMSLGMAAKARQELLDLGLVRFHVEIVRHKDGGGRYEVLTVSDVWPANFTFYARREQLKPFTSDETRAAAARAHLICFLLERGHQVVRHRPAAKGASPEFWGLEEARSLLASFLSDGGVSPHEHPPGGVPPREQGCSPHDTPGVSPGEHKKEPFGRKTSEEDSPPARQRATSSPRQAEAGEGGERQPLRLQDFRDHVEALSKTRAGAWIKDVEAVARSRWKRGKPEPEDVAEVKAFLAGYQPGSVETATAAPATSTPARGGMSLAVAKVQVGSIMRAPNAGPPAAIVEQMFSSGQISEEVREQLLEWTPTLTTAPAAPGVPRQPHLHVVPAQAAS